MHRDHRGARPSRMRRGHATVSLVPQRARGIRALRELQDPRQVWRGRRAGSRHPWHQVDFAGVPAALVRRRGTRADQSVREDAARAHEEAASRHAP
eukprot:4878186-Prymnesium_polylepis.1